MNQVAPREPSRDLAAPARSSEGDRSAKIIAQIDEHCLAPVRTAETVFSRYADGFGEALRLRASSPSVIPLVEGRQPGAVDRVKSDLATADAMMMPIDQAEEYARVMQAAWSAPPSRNRSGLCIARMIDSFPNARAHNPAAYRENLVHLCEVDGYSPVVVAMACDSIMRDPAHAFLPAPATFLVECRKAFDELQRKHRYGWIVMQGRHRLDTYRAELAQRETGAAAVMPADLDENLAPPPERSSGRGFV